MERTDRDVGEHVAAIAPASRRRDAEALIALMSEVTGREPELWSGGIIGFGSCHYQYPTGNEGDSPLVSFAARKTSSTLYLLDGVAEHTAALDELGPHATGVGCLYVKDLEKVDLDVLRGIVEESYRRISAGAWEYAQVTVTG